MGAGPESGFEVCEGKPARLRIWMILRMKAPVAERCFWMSIGLIKFEVSNADIWAVVLRRGL